MASTLSIRIAASSNNQIQNLARQVSTEFNANVEISESSTDLRHCLEGNCPDILIIDTSSELPEHGLDLIREVRPRYPELIILPLIPAASRELTKDLLDFDIFVYLYTPIIPAETTLTLSRAVERIKTNIQDSVEAEAENHCFNGIIGCSKPMQNLFSLIKRVAEDDESTVLIRGESGTGKELVAKSIHAQSSRNAKNFVPVNCAAIPDDLLESELFGYTKGAFTGASANKIGRIQYADGGTLFLDEIGDMKPTLQAKLLRVLQEKEFEPVGSLKAIPVDTRILAATHCDLEQLVSEGKFREDLYYRLSVIPLNIPALKNRRDDIPLLINAFIQNFTTRRNRPTFSFSKQAMAALMHFEWRGNVRELENLIQHMSILYGGKQVEFDDLPDKFFHLRELTENVETTVEVPEEFNENEGVFDQHIDQEEGTSTFANIPWHEGQVDFRELINSFETELILQAMKLAEGNKKEAARLLNLKRTTLLEKMKKKSLNSIWEE